MSNFFKSLNRCPGTNGLNTTMNQDAWAALCARNIEKAEKKISGWNNRNNGAKTDICALCKGNNKPAELTIRTIEEILMPTKREAGTCEMCGKDRKTIYMNHGVKVCSTCAKLQSAVSNTPEIVAAELKHVHGDKYFPKTDDCGHIIKIVAEIRKALEVDEKPMLDELPEIVSQKMLNLSECKEHLQERTRQLSEMAEKFNGALENYDELEKENQRISNLVEILESENQEYSKQVKELTSEKYVLEAIVDEIKEHVGATNSTIDVLPSIVRNRTVNNAVPKDQISVSISALLSNRYLRDAIILLAEELEP